MAALVSDSPGATFWVPLAASGVSFAESPRQPAIQQKLNQRVPLAACQPVLREKSDASISASSIARRT